MKYLLLIVLSILQLESVCQIINQDSIFSSWEDEALPDTVRLEAINAFIKNNYLDIQPDSIFYLAQLQNSFAQKKGLPKYIAKAINAKGSVYRLLGDFESAIELHLRALKICKSIRCKEGIFESVTNLGNVFFEKQDYEKAASYFNKSIESAVILGDKMGEADGWNDLAVIYKMQDMDQKAIECYENGLKILKYLSYDMGIAHTLCNLAVVNAKSRNFYLAINQYNQSYEILKELDLALDMAETLMNIGNLYNILGDSASVSHDKMYSDEMYKYANEYTNRALVIAQKSGSVIEIKQSTKDLISEYYKREESELRARVHDPSLDSTKEIVRIKKNDLRFQEIDYVSSEDKNQTISATKKKNWMYRFLFAILTTGISILILRYFNVFNKNIDSSSLPVPKQEPIKSDIPLDSILDKGFYINNTERPKLNKLLIEAAADGSLNDSDWNILNALYQNPGINNKSIAANVALSVDGVRSSLRKMYRLFDIPRSQKNQRIALIVIAMNISNNNTNTSD